MDNSLKAERLGNGLGDGNGMSWTINAGNVIGAQEPVIMDADKYVIRELAKRVASLATKAEQTVKKGLWLKHNALLETRPLIFCDPENAWYELIPAHTLQCQGNLARIWEFKLLKEIYWSEKIKDDRVIERSFKVQYIYENSSWGLDVNTIGGGTNGSYGWESPLKNYDDMEKDAFSANHCELSKNVSTFQSGKRCSGGYT